MQTFEVEFAGGTVTFKPASQKAWDAYLQKIKEGQEDAGNRQLLYACCDLEQDSRTGEHPLDKLLDEQPAAIEEIVSEIEEISGASPELVVSDDLKCISVFGITVSKPSGSKWSEYKTNAKSKNFHGGSAARKLLLDLSSDRAVMTACLESEPAALGAIMLEVTKLAGRGIKINRKKE